MPEMNAGTPNSSHHQNGALGSNGVVRSAPPKSLEERYRPVEWGVIFRNTLAKGWPRVHLLANPYLPSLDTVKGGWWGLIEPHFRPDGRFDGLSNRNGGWILTPQEQEAKHAVDAASLLLSSSPDHFKGPPGQTYFCFLEMSYAQFPDWAIVHRLDGAIALREDLLLCRPGSAMTMEATVVGPVFQLDPREVNFWETLSLAHNRGFLVRDSE